MNNWGLDQKNYMSQCFLLETRKSKQAVVIRKVNNCLSMHTQCGHFPQKYAVGPARKENNKMVTERYSQTVKAKKILRKGIHALPFLG